MARGAPAWPGCLKVGDLGLDLGQVVERSMAFTRAGQTPATCMSRIAWAWMCVDVEQLDQTLAGNETAKKQGSEGA